MAPEGSSHTIQQARRAFALKPLVLDPVEGERCVGRIGSLAMNLSLGLKDKRLYGAAQFKSDLCKGIHTVLASTECPQLVDMLFESILSTYLFSAMIVLTLFHMNNV